MSEEPFDVDRVAAVAARLDLREPNREALESIAAEVAQHFELEGLPAPFRCVVDSATGVGKTFILAAALEYFAGEGTRNFAVITPGRTILEKTRANFTAGSPKSLLGGMEVEPVVITSENFSSAAMRAAMDDEEQVKLYIFTVQSLTRPGSKQGKRTHAFNEGLGEAFYAALQGAEDLVVFADEHHTYFGPRFSEAVADLHPRVLIGLTATPHPKTPEDEIIFRYPLAAAIADHLVKTPVLVGRKDDRKDVETKLLDGVALLRLKEEAVARFAATKGIAVVHPLMLVVAEDIGQAQEVEDIVSASTFADGSFAGKVLTVHSKSPDEALEALGRLEEPGSPHRIVVSVGMLKEGWDNKAVYVIASLRPSISDILTEQTLGRGLRLPFGEYTGTEILDTLEVLAHERYEDLLKKSGVINQAFIDRRTRAVLRRNAAGDLIPTLETTEGLVPAVTAGDGDVNAAAAEGTPAIAPFAEHTAAAENEVKKLAEQLAPRAGLPALQIPVLKMQAPKSQFSLADITDTGPFEAAGKAIAADPEAELRRTRISAEIVTGQDGLRQTQLVTAAAVDKVESQASLLPLDDARRGLLDLLLASGVAPARQEQRSAAQPLVDAFVRGLGSEAEALLSAYPGRAAAKLIALTTVEQRKFAPKPTYEQVVEVVEFSKLRLRRSATSKDLAGKFQRGHGYAYEKSVFAQDWFDSGTERDTANILDAAPDIHFWLRLQRGDLPILWAEDRTYNPDFVAVEKDATHLLIEVKMQKEMTSADVLGKREAAKRWTNHVNSRAEVLDTWRYLLLGEDDVRAAKGSWPALKKLAS